MFRKGCFIHEGLTVCCVATYDKLGADFKYFLSKTKYFLSIRTVLTKASTWIVFPITTGQ